MRVLYLTHRLPYAPNRGDRIRSFHLLEGLRAAFEVDLVSLVHDEEEASHASDVAARGINVSVAPVAGVSRWLRVPFALPGLGRKGVSVAMVMVRAIGSPHWRNHVSFAG